MSFVMECTEEEYNAWVNNKRVRTAMFGEHHRAKCELCPGVFEDYLPVIDVHHAPYGVCFECAVKCYPYREYGSWQGILNMRKKHHDYWRKIVESTGDTYVYDKESK